MSNPAGMWTANGRGGKMLRIPLLRPICPYIIGLHKSREKKSFLDQNSIKNVSYVTEIDLFIL